MRWGSCRCTTTEDRPSHDSIQPSDCSGSDEKAARHDLVDLMGFMIATGVRVGEALGVAGLGLTPVPAMADG